MIPEIHHADCRDVLAALPENSIDSIVTDPPYGLQFMGKEWDKLWRDRTPADVQWRDNHAGTLPARARKLPDYSAMSKGAEMQATHLEWARLVFRVLKPGAHMVAFSAPRTYHRMACAIEDAGFELRDSLMWLFGTGFPKSHNLDGGLGTALKPAFEPIVLARKPMSEKTVAANVLRWGTGALNIDGCRIECAPGDKGEWPLTDRRHADVAYTLQPVSTDQKVGRWPANICHDGSAEVVGMFPTTAPSRKGKPRGSAAPGDGWGMTQTGAEYDDSGSAARFFYSAKASKADRNGSKHPTVKPIALMQWLARLVTPPGGVVLDPFAGSGTTGAACVEEGFKCVLVEREAEYVADIKRRFGAPAVSYYEDLLA